MKHKTSIQSVLVGSVAVVAALCFGAGQAHANHVACGDTITADATLKGAENVETLRRGYEDLSRET